MHLVDDDLFDLQLDRHHLLVPDKIGGMVGRLSNSRRKKDEKSGNGPQLRQTKLVLRVTAKRLTYTAKDANLLKFGEQTSIVQNVNLSETICIKCPDVSSTQKIDAITSNKDIPSTPTQCKDTISPDKLISRPRRNVFQKKTEACGLSWKEETELKKALYASLQRKKVKSDSSNNSSVGVSRSDANMSGYLDAKSTPCGLNQESLEMLSPQASRLDGKKLSDARVMHFNRSRNSGLYRAQRKFACGTKPGGGSLSSRRRFLKKVNCSLRDNLQNVPYTEDFIDYLCLRGTSFMPESLKIFDKILCTNVKTHLETPSTCSSSDLPRVRSGVGKVYGRGVRRKYNRTETRKSGLKNKEFTNAEKLSIVDCEGLPSIEKHRPLTRSFTKTEIPNGKDSGQTLCTGAFPSDPSEVDSLANHDSDDNDGIDDDDDDNDGDESEGLSEVLSCFVKDDFPLFYNGDSVMNHSGDVDCHDDDNDDDGDGDSGWIHVGREFPEERSDNPLSSNSDDKLDPAEGCCTEQCVDVDVDCQGCEEGTLFDESEEDDDDDDDDDEEDDAGALFCLELMGKNVNACVKDDSCIYERPCDSNNNEIGTCFGAVNKCIGTDAADFLPNSSFETDSSFQNHFPIGRVLPHGNMTSDFDVSGSSSTDARGCMLSMPRGLPVVQSPFKCIVPSRDRVVHDGQVLLANIPMVGMTSLSSVFMIPPVQNVNFIQFSSSPSVFTSWQSSGGRACRHEGSSVLTPAKMFGSSSVEFSPRDLSVGGCHSLRKIAPKISTERFNSSLEFSLPCQSCMPMNSYEKQNVQLIDGAQTCVSDLYLEQNNNVIKSYFKKQRRKACRKRVTEEYSSCPSKILESAEDTFQKDTGETQIQEPVSTINLRSGKVINVEEHGKCHQKTTFEKCAASDSSSPSEPERTRVFSGNRGVTVSKKKLLKKFQGFVRRKGVRNKRKKRRLSVELIDKSWIRSGLKSCNELSADGKPNRPTTRSRTLASMEDELTKAKMEFDVDDDDDDNDDEEEDNDL